MTLDDKVKAFLSVTSGSGYGDGSGDGYGYGSGDGSGDGSGSGSGYGDGYGYGSGSGSGSGSGDGYGWHITDLRIYDAPRELREFTGLRNTRFGAEPYDIKRAPQSWCYVEAIQNGNG